MLLMFVFVIVDNNESIPYINQECSQKKSLMKTEVYDGLMNDLQEKHVQYNVHFLSMNK